MKAEINVSRTGRYSLGQTSEILGIHRNTLRRYIKGGLIKTRQRKSTGQTVILGEDIIVFFNRLAW